MRKIFLSVCCCLAVFLCSVSASVAAEVSMADVESAAKGFGSAGLETAESGRIKIEGRMEGFKYSIYGDTKTKDAPCKELLFVTIWTGSPATVEEVNEYNTRSKIGKLYIDKDGDLVAELFVPLVDSTPKFIDEMLDWYTVLLRDVDKYILSK